MSIVNEMTQKHKYKKLKKHKKLVIFCIAHSSVRRGFLVTTTMDPLDPNTWIRIKYLLTLRPVSKLVRWA